MAPQQQPDQISVLFCCLGNICRSPMAEAVFADLVTKAGLRDRFAKIDSCGTGDYHEGEEPDERTTALCNRKKIPIDCLARGVKQEDFHTFDYILGMDVNNVRNLKNMAPRGAKATIKMFGDFDDGKPIADPYYGGKNGFEITYEQVLRYSHAFLRDLGLGQSSQL
ncbi:probable LTP1 - protein-tyrosine-phosphatase [Pseudozyma flocculosa]|uniref:Probable LTP1 - protein-tyrosine-phosphatase n=1 Tax=Pseudozyma flocculosa TaxID=84751 RepID=A0A5C3F265_9BASI|nr:probable LTP1 - protein-tyrosine-phosphatase [Pseudozyma flocculosa]